MDGSDGRTDLRLNHPDSLAFYHRYTTKADGTTLFIGEYPCSSSLCPNCWDPLLILFLRSLARCLPRKENLQGLGWLLASAWASVAASRHLTAICAPLTSAFGTA